jgi:translocation and assembly module TamB
MTWKERLIGLPLAAVGAVLVLATGAGMTLTRTDWGKQQVRVFMLEKLNGAIQGRVEIDAVLEGDLLRTVRMAGVRIYEPDGREFAEIDTLAVFYRWSDFLLGDINIASATLVGPVVNLRTAPGEGWNFEKVFSGRQAAVESQKEPGRRRRIILRNVTIRSGDVSIRTPWEPRPGFDPDSTRWFLEEVDGDWERIFRFERLSAVLAAARVEAPEDQGRLFQVSQLSCGASIVGHGVEIEQLRADVEVRRDTVSFQVWEGVLPDSRLSLGQGWVTLESDPEYEFTLRADPVTTQDVVWLIPQLPPGVANLDFSFSRRESGIRLEAQNARWESADAALSGRFAMNLSDRPAGLSFETVDLDVDRFKTKLIESITGWASPVSANLSGHVALDGPLSELALDSELRIEPDTLIEPSHVSIVGTAHARRGSLGATQLSIRADTLQLDLVRAFVPSLAVKGRLAGETRLNGFLADGLVFAFDVVQNDRALLPTRLSGEGTIRADTSSPLYLDVEVSGDSISLSTLAEYYPAIPFRGMFDGNVRALGSLDDLDVVAQLRGDGDSLRVSGNVQLGGERPRYRGELQGWRVALPRFRENLPATDLDFKAQFDASGTTIEDLEGSGRLDVFASFVGGVGFDSAVAALRVADARLWVDSSLVSGEFGVLLASGALSLAKQVSDSLQLEVRADSLGAFNPWFFPALESIVSPGLAADGAAGTQIQGRRVEGVARVHGWVVRDRGNLNFRGAVEGERLSYGDLSADSFVVGPLEVGEVDGALHAKGDLWAQGLGLAGLRFDELGLSGTHEDGRTTLDVDVNKEGTAISGRIAIGQRGDVRTIGLDALTMQFGDKVWALSRPAEIELAASGALTVDSLEVTSPAGAITMDGLIAASGATDFRAKIDGVNLANVVRLWPDSTGLAGTVSAAADLSGTARDPRVQGSFQVVDGQFLGVSFSDLRGEVDFQAGLAAIDVSMFNGQNRMFRLHGNLPFDLALPNLALSLPEREMKLTLEGDSLPLTLASLITDQVVEPRGRVQGTLSVAGTPRDLDLQGPVVVEGGGFRVLRSGIAYERLAGQMQFRGQVLELRDVSFRGVAGGQGVATGSITFTSLSDPEFDVTVQAEQLPAYDQLDAFAIVTGSINLRGRFEAPIVGGRLSVVSGIFFVEEVRRQKEIVDLFANRLTLIDMVPVLPGASRPNRSPFIENMTMDLGLKMEQNTWLRSAEMNIEIAGDLNVQMRPEEDEWRIAGTLEAVRGDYRFFNKRFLVEGGVIEFVGEATNPNLRIVTLYTVQTQKQPIEIQLILGGTLEEMTLELESDEQPPIPQSDLLSYLLFGRPSYELTRSSQERTLIDDVTAGVPQAFLGYALSSLLVGEAGIAYVDVSRVTPSGAEGEYRSGVGSAALAATQVEVGWYLAPTVFVKVAQHLVGAVRPTVLLDWRLNDNLTLRGVTEPRFGREGVLYYGGPGQDLEQSIGVFLFYGWAY